jgi:type IV pilus assembly protein PilC
MILMLTFVIPRIGSIITESGQTIPPYTKVVLALSSLLTHYGLFVLIFLVIGGFFVVRYFRTGPGVEAMSEIKLSIPYIGSLYQKLYLSRLADNMHTMLLSGIPMVRAIESTADIIDNQVYRNLLLESVEDIRAGEAVSAALGKHKELPNIMIQMMRVGEESGNLAQILETLSNFYRREVNNAVDVLVGLIEPVMIVLLGVGVGTLLASVLIPIYNISAAI